MKAVITVLEGSTVARQLPLLARYRLGAEVCTSVCRREYSAWSQSVDESDSIPGVAKDA